MRSPIPLQCRWPTLLAALLSSSTLVPIVLSAQGPGLFEIFASRKE